MFEGRACLALSGGIGGAKLALGLARALAPGQLTVVANTADDFIHLGLAISPDLDTVMYTLAGRSNTETGWGIAGETWHFLEALERLGQETWFRLGDRDLATHVTRTRMLASGASLTDITAYLCARLGVTQRILPMSDEPVATMVHLKAGGELSFQHYFVRDHCEPAVAGFHFEGARAAGVTRELESALNDPALGAIVICPSNPFVSIDPILAVGDLRERIRACAAPVVAISPIVGGQAIKGPTAKMMAELGMPAAPAAVAAHYGDLLDGFVIDRVDPGAVQAVEALGLSTTVTNTVMVTLEDRIQLARDTLQFAERLGSPP